MMQSARFVKHLFAIAALACALVACKDAEPATQLTVSIHSDLEVGTQISSVRVELFAATGNTRGEQHSFELVTRSPRSGQARFPFSVGVVKGSANRVRVVVTGFDSDDNEVVQRKELATFQGRRDAALADLSRAGLRRRVVREHRNLPERRLTRNDRQLCSDARADVAPGRARQRRRRLG